MFGRNKETEILGHVKELLASPEARPFIEAHEARALEARKKLVAQLQALDSPGAQKEGHALMAAQTAAAKRVAEAEQSLKQAQADHARAQCAIAAASTSIRRARLERDLLDAADSRIAQFINEVTEMWFRSGHCVAVVPIVTSTLIGTRSTRYADNLDEVTETRALLRQVIAEAKAMQLEALSRAEVAARLGALCQRIRKPLLDLGLRAPEVTDAGMSFPDQPRAAA